MTMSRSWGSDPVILLACLFDEVRIIFLHFLSLIFLQCSHMTLTVSKDDYCNQQLLKVHESKTSKSILKGETSWRDRVSKCFDIFTVTVNLCSVSNQGHRRLGAKINSYRLHSTLFKKHFKSQICLPYIPACVVTLCTCFALNNKFINIYI